MDHAADPAAAPTLEEEAAAGLSAWLPGVLDGVTPPLRAASLGGGRSNVTLLVEDDGGHRWVLRRPPPGPLLATAHDVVREGRIMRALGETPVPVPAIVATCDDESVLGVPFVVMEHVPGLVLATPADATGVPVATRRRAGEALVDALLALHQVDLPAVGLGDLVRPDGFVARQVRRWTTQVAARSGDPVPHLAEVGARLAAAPPRQQASALTHGDPKLVNCLLSDRGDLLALVDWELAAHGDPLADLALLLAYWAEPGDDLVALQDPPTVVDGFASRAELRARYAAGTSLDLDELGTYLAFSYWKLACIVQGVTWRLTHGSANQAADPAPFARQVVRLAEMAHRALDER